MQLLLIVVALVLLIRMTAVMFVLFEHILPESTLPPLVHDAIADPSL